MKRWQLQEAKARLSELVRAAVDEPQQITVHGRPTAVLVSQERYESLTSDKPTFVEFIRRSPLVGVKLSIERDKSRGSARVVRGSPAAGVHVCSRSLGAPSGRGRPASSRGGQPAGRHRPAS